MANQSIYVKYLHARKQSIKITSDKKKFSKMCLIPCCSRSVRNDKENAFALQENHHILKNLQEELTLKHEAYESLLEEHRELLKVSNRYFFTFSSNAF